MKLVDKMILFDRFLRSNKERKLQFDDLLSDNKKYFQEQSRYWRDKSLYSELDSALDNMQHISDEYNSSLVNVNEKINKLLREQELAVLRRDYDTYSAQTQTFELMQERALKDQEFIKQLSSDVGYYSDWRWSGVELNPSTGYLTQSMLACDPLYLYTGNIADTNSIRGKFNRFFAEKRLMFYNDLDKLPQSQLGLAASINCYEFWPMDPIKDEMRKVYNILRPGGYFIFTYNNCEQEASLDFLAGTESYRSYNTKTLMTSMVNMLGFDIVKEQCYREANNWMIVKKPGDLTSQKLTSPLIEIENSK